MDKKSLKELCTMRDALKDLLEHKEWLGSEVVLEKTLERIEGSIFNRIVGSTIMSNTYEDDLAEAQDEEPNQFDFI